MSDLYKSQSEAQTIPESTEPRCQGTSCVKSGETNSEGQAAEDRLGQMNNSTEAGLPRHAS